ncbi:ATP-binding protein [Streptomyces armeniacus]|uniref:ATP-binding protein n=1 Tax=Streptomyces armeniacus TaxID=83291 RepID=A0A345XJ07_9ACTN|nr:ATP-binding protein [Streptomyces armeniacus]AXK31623.1 ATP-binding protein [Streptomyces armeniacus]
MAVQREQPVTYEITHSFPRSRTSVPRARSLLNAALDDWGVGRTACETAELVLSELVTNAVRVPVPWDREVDVRIARLAERGQAEQQEQEQEQGRERGLLRLEVSDAGDGKPEVRMPGDDETNGRGLLLVEALSRSWGVYSRACGTGKTVWAELEAPGCRTPEAPG